MELFAPAEAGEEHQPDPISTGEDDEFILAARRAAQAAAQGTGAQNLRMAQGADRGRVKKSSRFSAPNLSFSLFRRTPSLKPRQLRGMPQDLAAAADSAALPPESGRRRLLLAAFLLLLAVSAYALRSGLKDTQPPPSPPHSETQPERPPGPAEKRGSLQLQNGPAAPQFAAEIAPDSVRAAAAAGDAKAQYLVAERLFDGKLNTKNPSEAAKWYEKAASQGFAPAQYRLGSLYERGTGVGQDLQEARRWYESAARQGNIKAMHNLGVLLVGGDDPDYAGSARWFSAAADHGLKDSQYNIAVFYERGLGVEKNAAEAYFWYSAAARQNDADALEKAKTIGESLAPSLKNGALMRLEQWTPAESAGEANSVTAAAPASRG
jgi:hypothetical protein